MRTERDTVLLVLYARNKTTTDLIKTMLEPLRKNGLSGKSLPTLGARAIDLRRTQIKIRFKRLNRT